MKESLEVLFLGPREWKALFRVPRLWKVEALFWTHYLVRFAPLDIYLQARALKRPFGDFRYGETPWFTAEEILREAELGPDDVFIDLGCGRGKMVFMAHLLTGAQAIGVDLLASYLVVARRIVAWLGLDGVSFRHQDFADTPLEEVTCVYVAGTVFEEDTRLDLAACVDDLAEGTRWISVGWQTLHPDLELWRQQEYLFSWGRETVYFHRVRRQGD
ncbi:MAG: cyclopropane-fatty-acyl-phospholipid synthase family protein [Vulcanimicrobiota bacterium]